MERTADSPILVLGTHRTTAPDRSAGPVRTIAQLYRLDGVRRLDLAGLAVEDIAEYLVQEGHLFTRAARGAATVLRGQTGGNPFFLRELWRDRSAHGGADLAVRQAPASVRDTILGRLERLPLPARQNVEPTADVGEDVEVATVLAAAEWSRETTLAARDEAFGLLECVPPSDDVLRFPHALCRQAVLDLMPASRRLQQHAGVAQAIESTGPGIGTTNPATGLPLRARLAMAFTGATAKADAVGRRAVDLVQLDRLPRLAPEEDLVSNPLERLNK